MLDFFQILAYNSKTIRLTKMKEHKTWRRITYLKVKICSVVYTQSIVKDRRRLPTWRKSELYSLVGTRNHSSNFGADPIIVANPPKSEIDKVSS